MTIKAPVSPAYGTGITVSPGAASASTTIRKGNKQLILTNLGANPCYVHAGTNGVTADASDYPVPAGAQVVITRAEGDDTLAHISPLGTTLHVMGGEGF